jgi:hypothetical protein
VAFADIRDVAMGEERRVEGLDQVVLDLRRSTGGRRYQQARKQDS